MGSMLEFGPTGGGVDLRVYISGDTIMCPELADIPRRYPDIDVGVVHLGGTTLLGLMMVTMDGMQGADWMELTGPRRVVPVHTDDYAAFTSPPEDFEYEVRLRGLSDRVHTVQRGSAIPLEAAFSQGSPSAP